MEKNKEKKPAEGASFLQLNFQSINPFPFAYCLLLIAYCLLPIAYFLLVHDFAASGILVLSKVEIFATLRIDNCQLLTANCTKTTPHPLRRGSHDFSVLHADCRLPTAFPFSYGRDLRYASNCSLFIAPCSMLHAPCFMHQQAPCKPMNPSAYRSRLYP
jgi:hypothetical protein